MPIGPSFSQPFSQSFSQSQPFSQSFSQSQSKTQSFTASGIQRPRYDFRALYINGWPVGNDGVTFEPSGSRRKLNLDNIVVPGQEFEKDKYKGRSVMTIRFDFFAHDDGAALDELHRIIDMCIPALSDTGIKLQIPSILSIKFGPLKSAAVQRMICSEDDGIPLFDTQKRAHKWGCTFRQWAQWMGPGVKPFPNTVTNTNTASLYTDGAPNGLSVASLSQEASVVGLGK